MSDHELLYEKENLLPPCPCQPRIEIKTRTDRQETWGGAGPDREGGRGASVGGYFSGLKGLTV